MNGQVQKKKKYYIYSTSKNSFVCCSTHSLMSSTTGSSSSSSLSGASSSNSPSASSSMGSPGSSGSPLGPVVLSPVDGKESYEPGRSGRNIYRCMHYFWIFLVNINLSPWKFNCYGMKSYCLDKNFDLLD